MKKYIISKENKLFGKIESLLLCFKARKLTPFSPEQFLLNSLISFQHQKALNEEELSYLQVLQGFSRIYSYTYI